MRGMTNDLDFLLGQISLHTAIIHMWWALFPGGDSMTSYPHAPTGYRRGWTLIVLLVVIAIIALLMALYLPSVLRMYSPPTTGGEKGTTKPVMEGVKERLAPVDQRSRQLEDYLPSQGADEDDQSADQNQ